MPIKGSVVIIWPLTWTRATTVGTMKFPQRTTKRALCLPQMLCVSLMFLVHFAIPIVKRLVCQTLRLHQHFIIRLITCFFFVCARTWSYSDDEAMKSIEVIPSKHWNHFCLWDRCPPTSTILKGIFLMTKSCSTIPLVAFLANKMSCLLGM